MRKFGFPGLWLLSRFLGEAVFLDLMLALDLAPVLWVLRCPSNMLHAIVAELLDQIVRRIGRTVLRSNRGVCPTVARS